MDLGDSRRVRRRGRVQRVDGARVFRLGILRFPAVAALAQGAATSLKMTGDGLESGALSLLIDLTCGGLELTEKY